MASLSEAGTTLRATNEMVKMERLGLIGDIRNLAPVGPCYRRYLVSWIDGH